MIHTIYNVSDQAGLPDGVLNYISISRESAPALTAEMIAHPLVRKINVCYANPELTECY